MRAASLEECMHGLLVHPPVRVHPCAALGCTAPLCPQGAKQLLMTCLRIAYISVEAECTAETGELPARFWRMLVDGRDDAGHGFVDFVAFEFAFPNSDGRPAEFFQLGDRTCIALDVAAKLCSQNSVLRFGVEGLQRGHRCQKHPFTKMAILRPGNAMSGLPGAFFH